MTPPRERLSVVVGNDQQVIHRILPLSLTFDHRAVTGKPQRYDLAA
jgi:pyruvate/2-oxoglutarate dehydrogenase complex dihydrolipoamide acyltransferase (E2) component